MLTEWTREMDVQPATNMNIATDNAHQVLLAQSYSAKRAKYLDGRVEHKAPNLPGKQSCACCPPTLKRDTQHVWEGLKDPSGLGRSAGGLTQGWVATTLEAFREEGCSCCIGTFGPGCQRGCVCYCRGGHCLPLLGY